MTAMTANYCNILFGSKEACQRHIVKKMKQARERLGFSHQFLNRACQLGKSGGNKLPTFGQVERDPRKLTGLFLSLVTTPLELGADSVIWEKLGPFLRKHQNVALALEHIRAKRFRTSGPSSDKALAHQFVTLSIAQELSA